MKDLRLLLFGCGLPAQLENSAKPVRLRTIKLLYDE